MRIYADEPESDNLNLTPLIDVVFLLLIFFLVATQFAEEERDLSIKLADVAKAQALSMSKDLVVNITEDGEYKVMQEKLTLRQLGDLLLRVKQKNPQQAVLIRGDRRTAWEYGVKVMGLCEAAEIESYRVAALEK